MKPIKDNNKTEISRKEALKKIGNYGKYSVLTALGTYMILNPKKAQAGSVLVSPDTGFGDENDLFEIE
jgi:hypothetical protein